jgi:hypothetical protein
MVINLSKDKLALKMAAQKPTLSKTMESRKYAGQAEGIHILQVLFPATAKKGFIFSGEF